VLAIGLQLGGGANRRKIGAGTGTGTGADPPKFAPLDTGSEMDDITGIGAAK
jgi:hypothetical protein